MLSALRLWPLIRVGSHAPHPAAAAVRRHQDRRRRGHRAARPASSRNCSRTPSTPAATRIDVDVEQGGTELIRVVDDGCGIAADDLPLAFASHATSKLARRRRPVPHRHARLPRRGAGVHRRRRPGDAAVAAAEPAARRRDHLPRRRPVARSAPWNGSPGTRIEVRHLFYNTPVRTQVPARPSRTEMGHVCETFTRLALAHPTLHLTSCGTTASSSTRCPASAGLLDRIGLFFGGEVRDAALRRRRRARARCG